MRTLKIKTAEAIKKIRQFHKDKRRMPTLEEMCEIFGFASKRSSFLLVERLVEAGLLNKDDKGRITLKQL